MRYRNTEDEKCFLAGKTVLLLLYNNRNFHSKILVYLLQLVHPIICLQREYTKMVTTSNLTSGL